MAKFTDTDFRTLWDFVNVHGLRKTLEFAGRIAEQQSVDLHPEDQRDIIKAARAIEKIVRQLPDGL